MTILVVDDEPAVPRLFDQRFRKEIKEGLFRFVYAASGEAALERLEAAADVVMVLSDINMPGMTGLELLDALRARNFDKPVYMVSAYDGSEFEADALARGAAGFLPKPLRFEDLNRLFKGIPTTPPRSDGA
jgi:CheY-like chemotaxis protein